MVEATEYTGVKNVIFDFGGVFLNIDFLRTFSALENICGKPFAVLFPNGLNEPLLMQLETGRVSPADFRQQLRRRMGVGVDDAAIDGAWNAMLLDLPVHRINLLRRVADHYRVFLLSNTNRIHYLHYNGAFRHAHGLDFDDLFEKAFWSHELGLRKPDRDCYDAVLTQAGLMAVETVFIDDSYPNVAGAVEAGLQGIHLKGDVADLFFDGKLKAGVTSGG